MGLFSRRDRPSGPATAVPAAGPAPAAAAGPVHAVAPAPGLLANELVALALARRGGIPDETAAVDVLRQCLQGVLLSDATGSNLRVADGVVAAGSTITMRTATDEQGREVVVAFTSQAEIARTRPEPHSIAEPSVGVLERAAAGGGLLLDPEGVRGFLPPTAVANALAVPRAVAVREAVVAVAAGAGRDGLAAVLSGARLVIGVNPDDLVDGQPAPGGRIRVRSTTAPDGSPAALAYTSGMEALARHPGDAYATRSAADVLREAAADGVGLVLDPAGPWLVLSPAEVADLATRVG